MKNFQKKSKFYEKLTNLNFDARIIVKRFSRKELIDNNA